MIEETNEKDVDIYNSAYHRQYHCEKLLCTLPGLAKRETYKKI